MDNLVFVVKHMNGQIFNDEEWNSVVWREVKTYEPTYDRFIFSKENKIGNVCHANYLGKPNATKHN